MERLLFHPHYHTSHPADRPWDQVHHTENTELPKKVRDIIKDLATSINNNPCSNQRQRTCPAKKKDISTYSPEYQQFARKAEKSMLNKKHEYSVEKDLSKSEERDQRN
jgi:hypothetical protein